MIMEDYVDYGVVATPFYSWEDLWSLPEDSNIFPASVNNRTDSASVKASIDERLLEAPDNSCNINVLREKTIVPSCYALNSFHGQETFAQAEPVINEGLIGKSTVTDHEDNSLFTTLKGCENLTPLPDESPIIFLEQENSTWEPSIDNELQENGLKYREGNSLSKCFEVVDQEMQSLTASASINNLGKRFKGKTREKNHRISRFKSKRRQISKIAEVNEEEDEEKQISKKEEHNAREKVRRMKLNASYLALGALLPDSRRKKSRSAPVIIDRALEYIPDLENETENLTLRKNNLQSTMENKKNMSQTQEVEHQAPTISVHEVRKGEVIIQICVVKNKNTVFSKLLENVEAEGMNIMSASTLQVCEDTICYNLHIQMNANSLAADYVNVLREE
ncbi:transcription factor ORG2-like [Melia azedarach]|nr:transcription factor ORG2-like [Melia azedarach]